MKDETITLKSESSNSQFFEIAEENRQLITIDARRYKPVPDAESVPKRMPKNCTPDIYGTMENGQYFTVFTETDAKDYTVEPLRIIVKFNDRMSTFAPSYAPSIYEDKILYDALSDLRYRKKTSTPQPAMPDSYDMETIRHIKSLPGMNCIEQYAKAPRSTNPVLVYQILTIARTLYDADRKKYNLPDITNTLGKKCNHTVQVIDVEESLINSASDIDFINLMYCDRSDLHKLIFTILNATGYAGYSYTDLDYCSGVYTTKTDTPSHFDKPFDEYVRYIDNIVATKTNIRRLHSFTYVQNINRTPKFWG